MKRLSILALALTAWAALSTDATAAVRYVYRYPYGYQTGPNSAANGLFLNWLMGLGTTILPQVIPQYFPTSPTGLPPATRDVVPNQNIQSIATKLNTIESNLGLPPGGPVTPPPTGAPARPTGGNPAFFPQNR